MRVDGDRVQQLLEHTTARDAFGVAGESHRNLGLDGLVGAHAHEVDVQHGALHRVALNLAGERELFRAVDLERDQRVGTRSLDRMCDSSRAGTDTATLSVSSP